jgi:hypothetical protein
MCTYSRCYEDAQSNNFEMWRMKRGEGRNAYRDWVEIPEETRQHADLGVDGRIVL